MKIHQARLVQISEAGVQALLLKEVGVKHSR